MDMQSVMANMVRLWPLLTPPEQAITLNVIRASLRLPQETVDIEAGVPVRSEGELMTLWNKCDCYTQEAVAGFVVSLLELGGQNVKDI